MNLTFTQPVQKPNAVFREYVRARLATFEEVVAIERAHVTLLKGQSHPPFRLKVHLVVPGPDLRADELAYTPEAALGKALAHLWGQVQLRKAGQQGGRDRCARRAHRRVRTVSCR